jgi:hypothetical protein
MAEIFLEKTWKIDENVDTVAHKLLGERERDQTEVPDVAT